MNLKIFCFRLDYTQIVIFLQFCTNHVINAKKNLNKNKEKINLNKLSLSLV